MANRRLVMPWKDARVEDERLRFVAEWLNEGWYFNELCEAYGVSRNNGYKWIKRYKQGGLEALQDRSRAPMSHPNQTAPAIAKKLIAARKRHPFWGPRKLLAVLRKEEPNLEWPAVSTAGDILKRSGLVEPRRRRRPTASPPSTALSSACEPNDVWAVDFKGWFRTGDGRRVDPLTITDLYSRYLLACRRVKQPDTQFTRQVFEAVFREVGLPLKIRSDNGVPFASVGLGGLTELSVWWIKLGIELEHIEPGRPDQNGCHERMHRTMKRETAMPPCANGSAQQRRFNRFRASFNNERPHEALNDTPPAQWYRVSQREYPRRLKEIEYPTDFEVRRVRSNGEIKWNGTFKYVSQTLIGEPVGLEQISDDHWKMWFGSVALGILDSRTLKILAFSARARHQATAAAAAVENSSRPPGSFRSPQPAMKTAMK
jgi:transposase InsO family protein